MPKVEVEVAELVVQLSAEDEVIEMGRVEAAKIEQRDGFHLLRIPATATPLRLKLVISGKPLKGADSDPAPDLSIYLKGGPARWNPPIATQGKRAKQRLRQHQQQGPSIAAWPWDKTYNLQ